jgi:hypoxanthine phosphoribosyltransferase
VTQIADHPVTPLISESALADRVRVLGEQIQKDYANRDLVIVSVLKGSFLFAADLVRAIDLPMRIEFFGVRSYGAATVSSGEVQITLDLTRPITGADVLVIEDIVDTGLTLTYLLEQLRARGPRSVNVCALLHKPSRSVKPVTIDYLGFTIEDVFVVGYGLDYAERYRNLPYVGVLDDPPKKP